MNDAFNVWTNNFFFLSILSLIILQRSYNARFSMIDESNFMIAELIKKQNKFK